jgi:hypothetical protein
LGAEGATFFDQPRTILGVMTRTFVAVERIVNQQERAEAELVIVPKIGHIRWDQTRRGDELIKAGYEAGLESIERIRELLARPKASPNPLPVNQ